MKRIVFYAVIIASMPNLAQSRSSIYDGELLLPKGYSIPETRDSVKSSKSRPKTPTEGGTESRKNDYFTDDEIDSDVDAAPKTRDARYVELMKLSFSCQPNPSIKTNADGSSYTQQNLNYFFDQGDKFEIRQVKVVKGNDFFVESYAYKSITGFYSDIDETKIRNSNDNVYIYCKRLGFCLQKTWNSVICNGQACSNLEHEEPASERVSGISATVCDKDSGDDVVFAFKVLTSK